MTFSASSTGLGISLPVGAGGSQVVLPSYTTGNMSLGKSQNAIGPLPGQPGGPIGPATAVDPTAYAIFTTSGTYGGNVPGLLNLMTTTALNDPWVNLDGRLNAPAGAAPYPTLLNSYVPSGTAQGRYYLGQGGGYQPPWHVAGVDYNVGPNAGTSYLDPSVNTGQLPAGVTYNAGQRLVRVNNNNTTLNGWDFSAPGLDGGGLTLYQGPTVSGLLVENCKFLRGSALVTNGNQFLIQNQGGNMTIQYCLIDDGALNTNQVDSPMYCAFGTASSSAFTNTFQYNWVKNIIVGHPWDSSVPVIDQFNLYDGLGYESSAHGNGGLFVGSNASATPAIIPNSVLQFRTFRGGPTVQGTNGFPLGICENFQVSSNNNCQLTNTSVAYNTMINPSYSTACYITHVLAAANSTGPNINNATTVHDNFVDPGDAIGPMYFQSPDPSTNLNIYNITNMTNGVVFARSPTTFSGTALSLPHASIGSGVTIGTVSADQSPTQWAIMGPTDWADNNNGALSLSSMVYNSGSGTITFTTGTVAHGLSTGNNFVVLGAAPAGYNGVFTCGTTTTTTLITPVPANPGAATVNGTLQAGGAGYLGPPGTYFNISNSGTITISTVGGQLLSGTGTYAILVGALNSGAYNSQGVTITFT